MLSRIFWVGIAGMALVVGMVIQDGNWIFDSVERELTVERDVAADVQRTVTTEVQQAIDGSLGGMQVVGPDGREIDVPPETKRAMADAVGRLVKAQAELAVLKIGDESAAEIEVVEARRAKARADVDRLKAEIRGHGQAAAVEQAAVRESVKHEVRDQIRTTVREAVGN